uniref:Uncharacterized protein n=1 Tax=Anguilla anguilla TaxID=7936 RepID=A0A0E9QCP7_ANGAN
MITLLIDLMKLHHNGCLRKLYMTNADINSAGHKDINHRLLQAKRGLV